MDKTIALLNTIRGYKTYVAAVGLAALAVYQLTQGEVNQAAQSLMQAAVAAGLRSAIATK